MTDLKDLINRYVAVWNEPDADRRREVIRQLWTEDGFQITPSRDVHGYTALYERVTRAYEEWVASKGFIFKLGTLLDAHHNVARFTWVMVPAKGGKAEGAGFDFFILSDDGRIQGDYQFNEPLPTV